MLNNDKSLIKNYMNDISYKQREIVFAIKISTLYRKNTQNYNS